LAKFYPRGLAEAPSIEGLAVTGEAADELIVLADRLLEDLLEIIRVKTMPLEIKSGALTKSDRQTGAIASTANVRVSTDLPPNSDFLRLARWSKRCSVLGPGVRAVVWVQGCPFRCPGCVAPETLPFAGGDLINIHELAREILALDGITGITFSGGEPMAQPESLTALVDALRHERDLSFMAYTGFTIDHLKQRGTASQKRFLGKLDILVDGPYIAQRHTDLIWRGSDNQRVIFLSDRHAGWKTKVHSRGTNIEFEVDHDTIHWMGIPPLGFREKFEKHMHAWGLDLTEPQEQEK